MRIGVIIPVYNEEKCISACLKSLLRQSLKPSQIIICDNESTDNSTRIADEILRSSDVPYQIVTEPKKPILQKGNINFAYWRASKHLHRDLDLVACLECDVILDKQYYETLAREFENDLQVGLACGVLSPLGFPDPFPLPEPWKMTWGANRVYRYSCWLKLNSAIDLRLLPAWDTDHNILVAHNGWKVLQSNEAISLHLRQVSLYHGISRGIKYRLIGYPLWWNIYVALRDFDPGLLVGYTCTAFWHIPTSPLKYVYQQALLSKLSERINNLLN